MRFCKQCSTDKDEAEFYKNSKSPDGLSYICKDCQKRLSRKSRFMRAEESRRTFMEKKEENSELKALREKCVEIQTRHYLAEKDLKANAITASIDEINRKKADLKLIHTELVKAVNILRAAGGNWDEEIERAKLSS